jgi:hypothetical protein
MATVAPEGRGAQPAPTPPVRHRLCRLTLTIAGADYRLSRAPTARAAGHLKKRSEPRAGVTSCALSHKGIVSCTCPDCTMGGAVCKPVRALKALGLDAKRAVPEAVRVARTREGGAR